MRLTKYGHSRVRVERATVTTVESGDMRLAGTDYAWLRPGTTIN